MAGLALRKTFKRDIRTREAIHEFNFLSCHILFSLCCEPRPTALPSSSSTFAPSIINSSPIPFSLIPSCPTTTYLPETCYASIPSAYTYLLDSELNNPSVSSITTSCAYAFFTYDTLPPQIASYFPNGIFDSDSGSSLTLIRSTLHPPITASPPPHPSTATLQPSPALVSPPLSRLQSLKTTTSKIPIGPHPGP